MKKVIIFILIFMLILLSACNRNSELTGTSAAATTPATTGTSTTAATSNALKEYLRINLPQMRRENQRLYYIEWGKLSKASCLDSVLILSDAQYTDKMQSDVYMVADVGGKCIANQLSTCDNMVIQNGKLSLADIDGDDVDEIVVHFEVSGNGGTITRVYKVDNGSIILLSDLDKFGTGYISEYENNYKLRISNRNTTYVKSLDISKLFIPEAFDEKGKSVVKEGIEVRPFSSCEIKDVDEDGKYELYCRQSVSLTGGYIGAVFTTLRYNSKTTLFEVVDSKFVAKQEY